MERKDRVYSLIFRHATIYIFMVLDVRSFDHEYDESEACKSIIGNYKCH